MIARDSLTVGPEGQTLVPFPAPARRVSEASPAQAQAAPRTAHALRAYLELTKPRLTTLILLVAVAGFCLASEGPPNATRLLSAILGISLLAAGIFALNQYLERDVDAVMRRTESRPLPTGRLQPGQALWFGIILSVLSVLSLALFANWLSGMIALFTLLSYLFLYTPLKTRSSLCTLVGALPGAVPPLLGWVAARGTVGFEAGVLFSILFLWQFPHFLAIGWLYREDYARAGIRMLPVIEPEGKMTGRQIVACALILLPVSLIPALSGLSGSVYFGGALVLGLWFLYVSIRLAVLKTKWEARRLLLASVLYLPLLFGLMVLNPNDLEVGWRNRKMEARSVSQRMGEATISNVRSIILSLAKEE